MRVLRVASFALLCALAVAAPLAADDKPPLTKEQERQKFHPRRLGMEAAARQAGYQKRLEMEKASLLSQIRFRNVGPEVQGGRVVEIAAPANHPDSLIVAFASGGLWRTDDRGGVWSPLFDDEPTLTIGSFALGDPDGKKIYVGTGESNSSRTSYAGAGMYKTDDGGKSWQAIGLSDTHHIGKVVVDPRDSETVYVAAVGHLYTENPERGVFVTRDGGKSWAKTLFVDERTGAIDLVQDPKNPDVLYAATWERARSAANFLESGPGSGVWKSVDAGKTWKRLSAGLPAGATVGRIGLAIAASRPQTVYAVLDNQARRPESETFDEETPPGELTPRRLKKMTAEGFAKLDDAVVARFLRRYDFPKSLKAARLKKDVKAGRIAISDLVAYMQDANREIFENQVVATEVYRSDDGGAAWKRTHDGRIDKVFHSYGYYFGRIAVDPADPERVYIQGVPMLTSTDGGKSWKGIGGRGVHGDYHAIFIDPKAPQRLAIGNDGGINVSYDYGETWTKLNNLPVGQFTILAVDSADPYNIVGGPPGQRRDARPLDLPVREDRSAGLEVDLRRRRQLRRHRPEGPEHRLRGAAVRHRGAAERQDRGAREHPPPARAVREEEREAAALQLDHAVSPLAALARHPLLRHQPALPLLRPGGHLDRHLGGPDVQPRAGGRPVRNHHDPLRVAEEVRRDLRRHR